MANPEHVAKLKEGVAAWNKWRKTAGAVSTDPDLSRANLVNAELSSVNLIRANLTWVDLSEAKLIGAELSEANLRHANLSGADLRTTYLSRTKLGSARLGGANLSKANLKEAYLNGAYLSGAALTEATLLKANFNQANLSGANLIEAQLSYANLSGANLNGASLEGANLTEVKFGETVFGNTDLRRVRGLETCTHIRPSTIDHRTLAQCGALPLAFLRGCGLSDSLITYLPSILNQAIQFYSCFISYSTKDQDFAERLHADLQDKGVRCWFAPHDIRGGKKVHEQIDEAIHFHDRLLLILSQHSMSSEWVKTEVANARQREVREKRQMLFPISLAPFESVQQWKAFDADTGKDSAREIREYFIPDFSRWKHHGSYKEALGRLLRDLKADEAKAQKA